MADLEAIEKEHEIVEISGGRTVVVQEWAFAKVPEMVSILGVWDKLPILVEHSVRPQDRDKIAGLGNKDLVKLGEAVYRINVTADFLKNCSALAEKCLKLGEGLKPVAQPTTESKKP